MASYLENLTARLARGAAQWSPDVRHRHRDYLRGSQNPDGGFSGREGSSDLYYTGFGLRGLALVGGLEGPVAQRAGQFLSSRLASQVPVIDLLSLLYGASLLRVWSGVDPLADAAGGWREAVCAMLEGYRRDDGGYAKTPEGSATSTYYSFLILLSYQLLDREPPELPALADFLQSRRRDDGGFVEIRQVSRSATNPTAAAVAALSILGALDETTRQGAARFLGDMQTFEGGLRANTRIPVADLLSTFTGLLTLSDIDGLGCVDIDSAERYVRSLELAGGGFRAATWDAQGDVEYTFYGLGTSALLESNKI